MDAAARVIDRLERVEAAPTRVALLGELRALVVEAEAWARAEGDARARDAVASLAERTEGMR